jgi:outer membrane murein-binding lipoprotein Lpp
MAESKRVKLERFKKKKSELQQKIAVVAVNKETYQISRDGGLSDFFSRRNPQFNAHRDKLSSQIRNLKKQVDMYDRKIKAIEKEIYSA